MAGLMGGMILSICAITPGTYNEACSHALDAGTQQSGIRRNFDAFEDQRVRMLNDDLISEFGPRATGALGGTVFVIGAIANRKLVVGLPVRGWCNNVKTEITPIQSRLLMEWNF